MQLKTKRLLLSARFLSVLVLLICAGTLQEHSSAAAETDLLDPTFILLHQGQTKNVQKEEKATGYDDTTTVTDIELKVSEPAIILPQSFLLDAQSILARHVDSQVSSADFQSSFQQENAEPIQTTPVHDPWQSTPKDELLKTNISSVTAQSDSLNKQKLTRLIEQISSMKMRPKPKETQSQPQPQDELKESISDVNEARPTNPELIQAQEKRRQSTQTLNPEIVQRLEQIIEKSGKTSEPQLLADMLYQTGNYELAAYFYELAISRDAEAQADEADNAWLMMQKAVCLDKTNPQQALQVYKSLISQYPASPWMELAKNRQSLVGWLEAQQPEKLIEQCRRDLQTN